MSEKYSAANNPGIQPHMDGAVSYGHGITMALTQDLDDARRVAEALNSTEIAPPDSVKNDVLAMRVGMVGRHVLRIYAHGNIGICSGTDRLRVTAEYAGYKPASWAFSEPEHLRNNVLVQVLQGYSERCNVSPDDYPQAVALFDDVAYRLEEME